MSARSISAFLLTGAVFASDGSNSAYTRIDISDPAVLPAEYARAIAAVYPAFVKHLEPKPEEDKSDLGKFLAAPMNYDVLIYMTPDHNFVVLFSPSEFKGLPVWGGGAKYEVNGDSFEIVSTEYGM